MTDDLTYYMKSISKFPLITREEENELAVKIESGCEESFEKLFCSNLRLVVKIALQYKNPRVETKDLISEGNIGLNKAVGKFKAGNNNNFSTYSSFWIKNFIRRCAHSNRTVIRLPENAHIKINKILAAQKILYYKFSRTPTIKELAEETGVSEISISSSFKYRFTEQPIHSVNLSGEKPYNYTVELEDKRPTPQYHDTMHQEYIDKIHKCVNSLKDKRKRKLIKMIFGVKPYRKRSRKECEKVFGICRERIRQLEGDALHELKFIFLSDGIDQWY